MEQTEIDDGPLAGPSEPYPGGGVGGVGKGSTRSPGTCGAYLQLFAGWIVLNLLTFLMAIVPHSAQFLDIEPGFNWGSGHQETDREKKGPPQFSWMDSSIIALDESYVVYGLWVLVEIALFFVLIVVATIVMCSCKNIPPGPGFIHILVDPAFVTLGSVPFLLIRGLPRVAALQACFIHSHTLNRKYHSAPLSDNGGAGVSGASSTPVAFYTAPDNRTNGNVAVGVRIGPGVQCLMALPYRLPSNLTALDGAGGVTAAAQGVIQNSLKEWLTLLQFAVVAPTVLRLLHFRWKMSWQPFLHSNCYFFLQALDSATLVQLSTRIHASPWNLLSQTLTYMAALALCLGSLTLAVPPVYTGNHVTNKYLKWSTYAGTVLIDTPFLCMRFYAVVMNGRTVDFSIDGIFCAMVIKEMVFMFGCLLVALRKVSQCVGSTYHSLSVHDPDYEEYELNGVEQYV